MDFDDLFTLISTHGTGAIDIIVEEVGFANDTEAIKHLETIASFKDGSEAIVAKTIIEHLKNNYTELF